MVGARSDRSVPSAVSQLSTRIVTFVLNLLIARHLSPEAYGVSGLSMGPPDMVRCMGTSKSKIVAHAQLAAVQFHLITTTILLLSREGLRRGCLRFRPEDKVKVVCVDLVGSVPLVRVRVPHKLGWSYIATIRL